ncbi:MAG: hypothetical protein PHU46_08335 [Rhodocyclaceae bacterium]|nr:hypothetical protein [Rhodocyclaceae bacterium]
MSAITFDTHKFISKLRQAGLPEAQAEAIADAFRDASGEAEVATKRDLKEMELHLDSRFESLKGEMTLIKWMLGAVVALAIANFSKQFF